MDADRNWPARLGAAMPAGRSTWGWRPPPSPTAAAVEAGRFWVFPHPEFVELAVRRWHGIAEGNDPELDVEIPGMPPRAEMMAGAALALEPPDD